MLRAPSPKRTATRQRLSRTDLRLMENTCPREDKRRDYSGPMRRNQQRLAAGRRPALHTAPVFCPPLNVDALELIQPQVEPAVVMLRFPECMAPRRTLVGPG